ncbi:MAG TPA: cytochrome b [Candidatus Binatia bacterium]|nr:cytochrome b [Candidatus Binatia bacterium]
MTGDPVHLSRYTRTAQLLHWLIALALFFSFSLGLSMADMPVSPKRLQLFSYHKWIGVTVFALVMLRLAWRLFHAPPPLPPTMRPWEMRIADVTHHLLYLFLFAMPLTGWLMSSAKGFQTVWLGVLPLPDLLSKNPPLGEALEVVHKWLAWMFLGLIGMHVAAAIKHAVIDRDEVLWRMLPRRRPPGPAP